MFFNYLFLILNDRNTVFLAENNDTIGKQRDQLVRFKSLGFDSLLKISQLLIAYFPLLSRNLLFSLSNL